MENLLRFIVFSLATWRLTSLFSRESGPFDVFVSIRKFIYTRTVYNNIIVSKLFMTINNGLGCFWCSSVWFGFILSVVCSTGLVEWFVNGLAFSTTAILLEKLINGESIN